MTLMVARDEVTSLRSHLLGVVFVVVVGGVDGVSGVSGNGGGLAGA